MLAVQFSVCFNSMLCLFLYKARHKIDEFKFCGLISILWWFSINSTERQWCLNEIYFSFSCLQTKCLFAIDKVPPSLIKFSPLYFERKQRNAFAVLLCIVRLGVFCLQNSGVEYPETKKHVKIIDWYCQVDILVVSDCTRYVIHMLSRATQCFQHDIKLVLAKLQNVLEG